MDDTDLVVVGAGIFGISAAATYYRLHPEVNIVVVEAAPSVGGPWASNRIFPGLKTNNLWGTYAHPDFPMDKGRFGVKDGEHVPANKVLKYLRALADHSGISDCVRLNTKVEVIEKIDRNWRLHCRSTLTGDDKTTSVINTAKLIISVGLVSKPSMPRFPTSPNFTPKILHSKYFPTHFSDVAKAKTHTLVVGGGKSAWDITYACATQPNATVTMLIRPSGNGPAWMAPAFVTPLGLQLEKLTVTRFFGFLSPCPWAETSGVEGWIRSFFQGTWLGRKIAGTIWGIMGDDVVQLNKLDDHPETKKLRPWRGAFEEGNKLSILNFPTDFFDLVKKGKVRVVIDDVAELKEDKEVVLKNGERLEVDTIVCATGWEAGNDMVFKPEGLARELGLPTRESQSAEDAALASQVETELYDRFPYLKERDTSRVYHPDPSLRYEPSRNLKQQPYRLYRFMVPISDLSQRSIGFAGALMSLGNAPCAYIQSLWLAAYLDGNLELPDKSPAQLKHETYRDTQYSIIRYAMGYGSMFPDLVWDTVPYFDTLMQDLGFEDKRKGKVLGLRNWGAECFQSYGHEDYKGLLEEWEQRLGQEREVKKDI